MESTGLLPMAYGLSRPTYCSSWRVTSFPIRFECYLNSRGFKYIIYFSLATQLVMLNTDHATLVGQLIQLNLKYYSSVLHVVTVNHQNFILWYAAYPWKQLLYAHCTATTVVNVVNRDAKLDFFLQNSVQKNRVKIENHSVCLIGGLSIGLLRGVNNYRLP